jgi:hypothetical protein
MVKNKPEKAYPIFKRIAKSNKKTQLTELESIRPEKIHKRTRLGSVKPIDLDNDPNRYLTMKTKRKKDVLKKDKQ